MSRNRWFRVLTEDSWVQTDMGNTGAVTLGLEKAEIEVHVSVSGMMKVIDAANRENTSGKFMTYEGTSSGW
jgi:norsolorinic acid ketoreductase